jgi:hypothetical protein
VRRQICRSVRPLRRKQPRLPRRAHLSFLRLRARSAVAFLQRRLRQMFRWATICKSSRRPVWGLRKQSGSRRLEEKCAAVENLARRCFRPPPLLLRSRSVSALFGRGPLPKPCPDLARWRLVCIQIPGLLKVPESLVVYAFQERMCGYSRS